jgi:tetratricopeptide (TPR) repeat protein/transglutaminase-like putative cysteine protease
MRLVLAVLLAALPALAADPWDAPPFTADPAAIAGAAAALPTPPGAEVEVLLEEGTYSYDAKGRETSTSRLVYRVLTPEGAKSWATVGVGYAPWHEERPEVRARVITPDGKAHLLDPSTLADSTPADKEPEMMSDRRVLRGPLPAIAEGAVVEQLITTRETESLFASGAARRFFVGREVPVRKVRLTLEVPQGSPLNFVARGLRLKPRRTEAGGRTRLFFEQGPLEPVSAPEPYTPTDAVSWPHVAFSTGRAWGDLARRYHETVEAQLAGAELERTAKDIIGGEKRREVVAGKLMKWIHSQVRYTSLQFGEAAVVPRQPAEVLVRRYGDCKDLSTLLVGLLRASGIPASVALLRTGLEDVQEPLPGFGLFDHAIVYVPGTPALWIDATDAFSPPGQLPAMVQGRLALVAHPDTRGLVRTSELPPSANRIVTMREVFLSERGASRIIETKETTGTIASSYREHFTLTESSRVREGYLDYVKSTFSASDLKRLKSQELEAPENPFRVELEVEEASRGYTDDKEAAVGLGGAYLLGRLPDYLLDEPSDEGPSIRQSDLVLLEPYVGELRYRVIPPPGYSPRPLPKDFKRRLGPATYSGEYTQKGGEVHVTFRFDAGKRRWSPAEVSTFREALDTLREEDEPLLGFDHDGAALMAAGRVHEALEAYRRMVEQHPNEALHRSQAALALLEAGIGEEARAEARRATEVEPSSVVGWRILGWVLQHDSLGRRFKPGFDYAGALAAYRKARAIDPDDFETRGDLGILLEYGPRGERYGEDSRLEEAVEEYKALREELDRQDMDDHLLLDLFLLERYAEVLKLASGLEPSALRNSLRLSASVLVDGSAAAVKNATKWVPTVDARREALEDAASRLMSLRRYPEAHALLTEAARGAPDAVEKQRRLTPLGKAVRFERKSLKSDDPRSVVQRFFLAVLDEDDGQAQAAGLIHRSALSAEPELAAKVLRTVRILLNRGVLAEIPQTAAVDLALSLMELRVEGDAKRGYRIQSRLPLEGASTTENWFLVRSGSELRLLGMGYDYGVLGQEAMRRAEAGDLEGARQWLDWTRDSLPLMLPENEAGANFLRLWKKGASTAGKDELRVAAASLMAFGNQAVRAIPFLSLARERASTDTERRGFDRDLMAAYAQLKRLPEVLETADRLLEAAPVDETAYFHATYALRQMDRPDELAKRAEARLRLLPDDEAALETLASAATMRGDLAKAQEYRRRIVEAGKATAHTYNELAWNTLFLGKVDEAAVEDALKANTLTSYGNANYVHTLATLYAELGKGQEARQLLLKSLELHGTSSLQSHDWYVVGRIAESYGLMEEARAAYQRAKSPKPNVNSVDSLATTRLKVLEKASRTVAKPAP